MSEPADLFYLQDSRSYAGNLMYWWREGGAGYTSAIEEAGTFTRDEAYRQHIARPTDVPWSKAYIDARVSRHVDMQRCSRRDLGSR